MEKPKGTTVLKCRVSQTPITEAAVDIIVPFVGCYQKLYDLCKSIWRNTRSNRYRLYLVDDCSPNKTYVPAFKEAPYTTIVQNDKQLGFGASLKVGFDMGKNPWIVIMHSDCLVETSHWLTGLFRSFFRNPQTGMVSPLTNNPGVDNINFKGNKADPPRQDYVLEKGYLPLYCALCQRDLFSQIGGFIKAYPFRYYEDEELAHRMRRYGLQQVISGSSWVRHYGAATVSSFLKLQEEKRYNGPDYRKIIAENRDRCIVDLKH